MAEKQELLFIKIVNVLCQRRENPRLPKKVMLPPHPEKQMGRKELFETVDSLLKSVRCLVMWLVRWDCGVALFLFSAVEVMDYINQYGSSKN